MYPSLSEQMKCIFRKTNIHQDNSANPTIHKFIYLIIVLACLPIRMNKKNFSRVATMTKNIHIKDKGRI